MCSFIYRHPILYNKMLRLIHRKALYRRYRHVADTIGGGKKVFELACGTALIHRFLHNDCKYIGWDLNARFVQHCKDKGINAKERDIFDFNGYPKNDVTIVCDVLHHIFPRDRQLVENALKKTKKLIIVEPYHRAFRIPEFIMKRIESLDDDGINKDPSRYMWNINKCKEFLAHFGDKIVLSTRRIGLDIIAVFDRGVSS